MLWKENTRHLLTGIFLVCDNSFLHRSNKTYYWEKNPQSILIEKILYHIFHLDIIKLDEYPEYNKNFW